MVLKTRDLTTFPEGYRLDMRMEIPTRYGISICKADGSNSMCDAVTLEIPIDQAIPSSAYLNPANWIKMVESFNRAKYMPVNVKLSVRGVDDAS